MRNPGQERLRNALGIGAIVLGAVASVSARLWTAPLWSPPILVVALPLVALVAVPLARWAAGRDERLGRQRLAEWLIATDAARYHVKPIPPRPGTEG